MLSETSQITEDHSYFGPFFSPGIGSEIQDVHRGGGPRIVTGEIQIESAFPQSLASLYDEQKISEDFSSRGLSRIRATKSSSASCPSASPAAMFLSSLSPTAPERLPDAEGKIVAGYTLAEIIGYGGFSTIRRASSPSGGVVAVKIVRRSDIMKQGNAALARRRMDHEATTWSSLSHEHILPLFSSAHTPYADYFFTLFCPAGSLYDILKREGRPALPQDDAGMMFRQVVRGLRYLHEVAGYVHRDIKLENVLVDEVGMCRITDFGMARKIGEIDEEEEQAEGEEHTADTGSNVMQRALSVSVAEPSRRQTKPLPLASQHPSLIRHQGVRHRNSTSTANVMATFVCQPGSLPYAAPELLIRKKPGPYVSDPSQDIWALGILLYALLTGRLPWTDSFEPRLQIKILHSMYRNVILTSGRFLRFFPRSI